MKALILNSGLGSRMGVLISEHPKCMTEISSHETILSRQLRLIADAGVEEVVITTGYYDNVLINYISPLLKIPSMTKPITSILSIVPENTFMMTFCSCMGIWYLKTQYLTRYWIILKAV